MKLEFEWDIQKLKSNYNKHGVSFDEALTVFDDDLRPEYDIEELSQEI